jgi:hypothetical protein
MPYSVDVYYVHLVESVNSDVSLLIFFVWMLVYCLLVTVEY